MRTLVNSASILGGEAFSRLATFVIAIVVAHRFGSTALGQYGFALAFASIVLLVPDLGLNLLVTRDLAARPETLRPVFWGVHWLKLGLVAIVAASTFLFGECFIHDSGRRTLVYILVSRVLLLTFSQIYMAVFKAFETMQYIALQQLTNMFLVLVGVGLALGLKANLDWLVAATLVGQVAETWLGWHLVRRHFTPGALCAWDRRFLSAMLAAALPVGVTAILQATNIRIDILILGMFASNEELGRFQAAAWFTVGTFLAAALLMTVLFPKLARLLSASEAQGSAYVASLMKHTVPLLAAGSLLVWLAAPQAVVWLFGPQLASAAQLLRVLAAAIPFTFFNTVLFYVFVAARRRRVYLTALGVGSVVGAGLSVYLAWRYGALGSAYAGVFREFLITVLFLYAMKRAVIAPHLGMTLLKVSLAALGLALFVGVHFRWGGVWSDWPAAGSLFLLVASLVFVGPPNRRELLLLAGEGV